MVYQVNYEGYYSMSHHDMEENALKRWFDNFKIDRYALFATDYECLLVKEVPATAKHISKRQVCVIEDLGRKEHQQANASREVIMDHTAPPAPMLSFAAKRIWQPPPPKSAADLKREAEYERMYRRGYEPRYRRVPVNDFTSLLIDHVNAPTDLTLEYREEIEWVPRQQAQQQFNAPLAIKAIQSAPKHRRNI